MFWPCETRTSICRNLATISSGLYRFLAITVLLDVKDIPQVGPLQWGWITKAHWSWAGRRELHSAELRRRGSDPVDRERMVAVERPQWIPERRAQHSDTIKETG